MYKHLWLAAVLFCGIAQAQNTTPLNQSPGNSPTATVSQLSASQMQDFKMNRVHTAQKMVPGLSLGNNPSSINVDKIDYTTVQPVGVASPIPLNYNAGVNLAKGATPATYGANQTTQPLGPITSTANIPLTASGNLKSVDGYDVEFELPKDSNIYSVCATKRPVIHNAPKDAACSYVVPCDNPANRDAVNTTTIDYFQLEWHVMMDGGPSSNIDQTRIDQLMAELNADYASANMVFCADPATFTEDAVITRTIQIPRNFHLKQHITPTLVK